MSDSMLTAAFIILSGGLQDAYTYLCRGKVYANAQTGNIVLLSPTSAMGNGPRRGVILCRCWRLWRAFSPPNVFTAGSGGWSASTGGR